MNQQKDRWGYYLPALFLACAALYFRIESFSGFPDKFLWAEDGKVFLHDASTEGLGSLIKPSAGYLHLYIRLVAGLSTFVDLEHRPSILFGGWFAAWTLMIVTLTGLMRSLGAHFLLTASIATLVTLQPHNTEVLFNLTNAQWMTGPALFFLTIHAVLREGDKPNNVSIPLCMLLLLLSLTGPFSIILACALLIVPGLFRPRALFSPPVLVVFVGACTQLAFLLSSPRMASSTPTAPFGDFAEAVLHLFTLGADTTKTYVAVGAFWALVIWRLIKEINDRNRMVVTSLLLLLLCGVVSSSLFAARVAPLAVGIVGAGNRYTWIPYALALAIGGVAVIGTRAPAAALMLMAGLICHQYFLTGERPNLEFRSYARFAKHHRVIIPISPVWPLYPGWHLDPGKPDAAVVLPGTPLDLRLVRHRAVPDEAGTRVSVVDGELRVHSSAASSGIALRPDLACNSATDIGVEIDMTRSASGFVELAWKDDTHPSSERSIRRWYPDGSVTAQFAYPHSGNSTNWQILPLDSTGDTHITAIRYYCIEGQ